MEEKLDFSLPQKKQKSSCVSVVTTLLLLVLIGLTAANVFLKPSGGSIEQNQRQPLSAEQTKQLAIKLASRNLYKRAAEAWQDYLSSGRLSDNERAKALFQTGALLEKGQQYDKAIEYYYRSEMAAKISDLESQINANIKNCFEKLGKFSALRYELMDRTSIDDSVEAGTKVIAQIGPEKITQSNLDEQIEIAIDSQLEPVSSFMTNEQMNQQKKAILQQYADPSIKYQFLQSWIAQEVLYRQGLENDLLADPKTHRLIDDMTRGIVSQKLMNNELADKINITEADVQTYYQANKERYKEPSDKDDPNSPPKQLSFEEAKQQAMAELADQKRQDVQQQLIERLMDKYNVIIHKSVFTPTDPNQR